MQYLYGWLNLQFFVSIIVNLSHDSLLLIRFASSGSLAMDKEKSAFSDPDSELFLFSSGKSNTVQILIIIQQKPIGLKFLKNECNMLNFNFLLRLKYILEKNLNEYIKWVILIGLYGFYRMMAAVIEPGRIMFLLLPLIAISFLVFTLEWIIESLIAVLIPDTKPDKELKKTGIRVILFLMLGITGFVIFLFTNFIPFFSLGFFGLISSVLSVFLVKRNPYFYLSLLLMAIGLTGMIFSFVQNTGFSLFGILFYLGFTVFYFFRLYQNRRKKEASGS